MGTAATTQERVHDSTELFCFLTERHMPAPFKRPQLSEWHSRSQQLRLNRWRNEIVLPNDDKRLCSHLLEPVFHIVAGYFTDQDYTARGNPKCHFRQR